MWWEKKPTQWTYGREAADLSFILDHPVLLLPHGHLGCLVLPQRPLLLQLRAPERLNGVHGGAKFGLFGLQLKEIIKG